MRYYTGERLYRILAPLKRHGWLTKAYSNFRYLSHILCHSLAYVFAKRLRRVDEGFGRQVLLVHETAIPESTSWREILQYLTDQGMRYGEGGHTFYVPPQDGLEKGLGAFVQAYPADAGFKIVRNLDAWKTQEYLENSKIERYSWLGKVMAGSVLDVLDGACLTEILALGPRIYDLVELRHGAMRLLCYVVQHQEGGVPADQDHKEFIGRLSKVIETGLLSLVPPQGLRHVDFDAPGCNGNLIKAPSGRCAYVDFQQFILADRRKLIDSILADATEHLHFGSKHFLTDRKFLYQEIPALRLTGKRDMAKRRRAISGMLLAAGVSLKDKLAMDVCCNSAMVLAYALSSGAYWGLGWDIPEVARCAKQIQLALGNTRMDVFGCTLGEEYRLLNDVPAHLRRRLDGCVVFYLAAWQHIGFIRDLANVPFKALVFEGHENDSEDDTRRCTERIVSEWRCELAGSMTIRDGHCGSRDQMLFVRK